MAFTITDPAQQSLITQAYQAGDWQSAYATVIQAITD